MATRRGVILGALALAAGLNTPSMANPSSMMMLAPADPKRAGSVLDDLAPKIAPYLDLKNSNTGETFTGSYFVNGAYDMDQVLKLNWFMRDWRRKEAVLMDVRLFWALSALRQAAMKDGHDGRIVFTSGYRTKRTNDSLEGAARDSLHLRGQANDFAIPGIPTAVIYKYALWLDVGGVGHYPNRFIHIDTGRERTWRGSLEEAPFMERLGGRRILIG